VRLTPAPSAQYEKSIYLIALKNQDNIRAAEAYWVDGGTLNYVTLQHERKQAPLTSIDRAFGYRLNREHRLPPASGITRRRKVSHEAVSAQYLQELRTGRQLVARPGD
jgi:hypothetical protein